MLKLVAVHLVALRLPRIIRLRSAVTTKHRCSRQPIGARIKHHDRRLRHWKSHIDLAKILRIEYIPDLDIDDRFIRLLL